MLLDIADYLSNVLAGQLRLFFEPQRCFFTRLCGAGLRLFRFRFASVFRPCHASHLLQITARR